MPQATDELRDRITLRFGGIDAGVVVKWLKDHDWELTHDYSWKKPNHVITKEEWEAIDFLIQEWDFGGVE